MKDEFSELQLNRYHNGRILIKKFRNKTEFAKACGMYQAQVTNYFSDNPTAPVGQTIARRVEEGCEKPPMWLDHAQEGELAVDVNTAVHYAMALFQTCHKLDLDPKKITRKQLEGYFHLTFKHYRTTGEKALNTSELLLTAYYKDWESLTKD